MKVAAGVMLIAVGVLVGAWSWVSPVHVTMPDWTGSKGPVSCGRTAFREAVVPYDVEGDPAIAQCNERAVERVVVGGAAGVVFLVLGVVTLLAEMSKRRHDQLEWWFNKKLWPDRTVWTVFVAVAVGWSAWLIGQALSPTAFASWMF